MPSHVIAPPPASTVAVAGTSARFPVHRIYCVGQNYAAHVREMGGDPDRTPPIFFTKPADAVLADGSDLPYPPRTADLHYEAELVVALAGGGRDLDPATALELVYGYAVGNDFTRRDLQAAARAQGRPWDTAKGFDHSAAIGAIQPVSAVGHPRRNAIWLTVNGAERQRSDLGEMIWDVAGILAELSRYWTLAPGDLVYTGTPQGVGPVRPGDVVVAGIEGLGTVTTRIATPIEGAAVATGRA
jgi:fumarylpyruvate hydrolase